MGRTLKANPEFKEIPPTPWYPDKSYSGEIRRAQRELPHGNEAHRRGKCACLAGGR
jgi:hypothetical protein